MLEIQIKVPAIMQQALDHEHLLYLALYFEIIFQIYLIPHHTQLQTKLYCEVVVHRFIGSKYCEDHAVSILPSVYNSLSAESFI